MNHIRLFNEGLSENEIKQDIRDICLDITDSDIGFEMMPLNYREFNNFCDPLDCLMSSRDFGLMIDYGKKSEFEYKKVREVIERIKEYMKMNGYKTMLSNVNKQNILQDYLILIYPTERYFRYYWGL